MKYLAITILTVLPTAFAWPNLKWEYRRQMDNGTLPTYFPTATGTGGFTPPLSTGVSSSTTSTETLPPGTVSSIMPSSSISQVVGEQTTSSCPAAVTYTTTETTTTAITVTITPPTSAPTASSGSQPSSGACTPGTYQCKPDNSGWNVCDVEGVWVNGGSCGPSTTCSFNKVNGSPYCI